MLSSIHPLGERARHNRWLTTVVAHVVGSTLGGLVLGATAGGIGVALALALPNQTSRLSIAGVAAVAACIVDWRGWPRWLWRPRRQVDENWINLYRGWVYGAGWGLQLGLGLTTIVTAATVYVLVALCLALGQLPVALLLGTIFGAARGLSIVAGRSITTPERLVQFHRRLHARAGWGRRAAVTADGLVALGTLGLVIGRL